MKTYTKYVILALAALLVVSLVVCGGVSLLPATAAGTTYYVDCSAGSNGDGSQSSPWNNVTTVSTTTFSPGDTILFKRGTTCVGELWPKGSGTAASPITIDAYGTGALPIISGATQPERAYAIRIENQSGWHIQNMEACCSKRYAVWIGGTDDGTYSHFRLTNLVVHDAYGRHSGKTTGLVEVGAKWGKVNTIIDDVIIDGVTAYNTDMWNGLKILCNGQGPNPAGNANPVIIRNSSVDNTEGDGIVIFACEHGTIENTVASNTGLIDTDRYGTPNSTWTWACDDCLVQYNEAYLAYSPAVDGGGYDIDYYSSDNTYQYNYAHDNEGYCIAVLGAENTGTTNSIVRYNICSNNCQEYPSTDGPSSRFGDFDVFTWNGGWLDGVAIYNNTVYWNPADGDDWPAFCNGCIEGWPGTFQGTLPNFFMNNVIYSETPNLVFSLDSMTLDNNIYWYTGTADPMFAYGGPTWADAVRYTSFAAYQAGSGQDTNGYYTDPQMNDPTYSGEGMPTTAFTLQSGSPAINAGANLVALGSQSSMGSQDFYGNAIPQSGAYDIGAHEYGGTPPEPTDTPVPTDTPIPPTDTPQPGPTDTPASPTDTPEPGPTDTPVPPTDTPVPPTDTPAPTNTPGGGGTIFFDGFEDGEMSDWSPTNNAGIRTERVYEGVYSAGAKLSGSFSRTISTAGYTDVRVKYAGLTWDMEEGDYLLVEWYDGSSWATLDQLLNDGTAWTLRDWDMPAGADENASFALRFTGVGNKNTEWAYADSIEVTGE